MYFLLAGACPRRSDAFITSSGGGDVTEFDGDDVCCVLPHV